MESSSNHGVTVTVSLTRTTSCSFLLVQSSLRQPGQSGTTSAVGKCSKLSNQADSTDQSSEVVAGNPPSISGTAMPFSERHFRRLKTCFHFLATYVAPQHKITEAGKWITWLVYAAFDEDRLTPTPFTGFQMRSDVSYGQTRITEKVTNVCHLTGVSASLEISHTYIFREFPGTSVEAPGRGGL